ncbi:MAG: hypothetical protein JRE38_05465, partial [Deltaproteobacteria bacterium]|nr:hypothetical protein [Deltaproteobacteria bacterium]
SVRYGFGVLKTSLDAFLQRKRLAQIHYFDPDGQRLDPGTPPQSEEVTSLG